MSSSSTVEVTRHDDGGYTAIDEETGARGEGTTRAGALEDLASNLQNEEFTVEESTPSLSEESLERITESEEEFDRGDYVMLDDP